MITICFALDPERQRHAYGIVARTQLCVEKLRQQLLTSFEETVLVQIIRHQEVPASPGEEAPIAFVSPMAMSRTLVDALLRLR